METFVAIVDWLTYSYAASVIGGAICFTLSAGSAFMAGGSFKRGFEIESIRLMFYSIWWFIATIWWKL